VFHCDCFLLQALPVINTACVLTTLSQETHAASGESGLGVEAFTEAAAAIQASMQRAGLEKLEHLIVKYLPLHLLPLGNKGFQLLLPSAVHASVDAFFSAGLPQSAHACPLMVRFTLFAFPRCLNLLGLLRVPRSALCSDA
jgi:hypothetical protein